MSYPEKITYISGVPRSGTSWLGQIFDSAPNISYRFLPFFSYEFKNCLNEDSTKEEIKGKLNEIFATESPFLVQEDKRVSGDYPRFSKNSRSDHLVLKENRYQNLTEPILRKDQRVKLVAIVRNPNAVLCSWMKNPKEFPEGSEPLKEWRYGECKNQGHEDFFGYYKWKEATNLYLDLAEKYPKRVRILQFEHLVCDPVRESEKLFEFAEVQYGRQTASFIENSENKQSDSYYSVYKPKNVVDKWRQELDPYITSEIKHDLTGTRLEKFLI